MPEQDEFKFDFDLLDPTKLIPESIVPVTKLGKLVLNRNVENFFSETEQITLHPGHLVRGTRLSRKVVISVYILIVSFGKYQVSDLPMIHFCKAVCSATLTRRSIV